MDQSAFEANIRGIDSTVVDLTWPGALFNDVRFREFHANPLAFQQHAQTALANHSLTSQQKVIVGLSMQGLPLQGFLSFSRHALHLLDVGAIDPGTFRWIVFPTYDWNHAFADNHRAPEVKAFLSEALLSDKVPDDLKKYIREEIQSGNASKVVNRMRQNGEIKG